MARLSSHFERKGEKLPSEVVAKLVQAKNLNAGLLNLRQIFFASFDLLVHTTENEDIDLAKTWQDLKAEITLIPCSPNTWPVASFGHIMGGYDAGYYGYMWSQVFSADMFHSRFKQEGVSNPETGLDYRKCILVPGGSRYISYKHIIRLN